MGSTVLIPDPTATGESECCLSVWWNMKLGGSELISYMKTCIKTHPRPTSDPTCTTYYTLFLVLVQGYWACKPPPQIIFFAPQNLDFFYKELVDCYLFKTTRYISTTGNPKWSQNPACCYIVLRTVSQTRNTTPAHHGALVAWRWHALIFRPGALPQHIYRTRSTLPPTREPTLNHRREPSTGKRPNVQIQIPHPPMTGSDRSEIQRSNRGNQDRQLRIPGVKPAGKVPDARISSQLWRKRLNLNSNGSRDRGGAERD